MELYLTIAIQLDPIMCYSLCSPMDLTHWWFSQFQVFFFSCILSFCQQFVDRKILIHHQQYSIPVDGYGVDYNGYIFFQFNHNVWTIGFNQSIWKSFNLEELNYFFFLFFTAALQLTTKISSSSLTTDFFFCAVHLMFMYLSNNDSMHPFHSKNKKKIKIKFEFTIIHEITSVVKIW